MGAQFCSRLAIAQGEQKCLAIAGKWDQRRAVLIIATEVVGIEGIASIPAVASVVSVAEPISISAPVAIVAASISIAAKSSTAECSATEPTSAEPPTVETASAKTASMETSTAKTASMATATATASERYSRLDQDDCRKYEQGFIQFPHDASSIGTISFPRIRHLSLRIYFGNRRTLAVN
jgi:hypothetical protein